MAWYTAFAMALALVLFANGADTANAAPEQRISLAKMTGEWRGSGWGVRHATAPRERVRCRMRAKYRAKSRKLILSGKCAATSRSFTILGHLAEYPGNKRITGALDQSFRYWFAKYPRCAPRQRVYFYFQGQGPEIQEKTELSNGMGHGTSVHEDAHNVGGP